MVLDNTYGELNSLLNLTPSADNDPSAGSPTETLLRLLLPLDNLVCKFSKITTIYARQ